jgi:hypothetical protein
VPDAAPVDPPLEDPLPVSAPPAEAPPELPPNDSADEVFVGDAPSAPADDTFELLFSDLWDEEIVPTETVVEEWDVYEVLFAVWFEDASETSAPEPTDEPEAPPSETDQLLDESNEPGDEPVPISAIADDDSEGGFWSSIGDFLSSVWSGITDELRDQRDGLQHQLSDPWRAFEFFGDQVNPGGAALRRLANGEPDPLVVKGIQIRNELLDDTGHGVGRGLVIGVELWATRRVAGAAGGTATKVPLVGAGPKVIPGAPLAESLANTWLANPKLVPVAIRKNGMAMNFENPASGLFAPFGALKAAELGANEPVQSTANLKREISIWLQSAGVMGLAPERIKWYRDEFAKLTTDAEREAMLGQLRTEVRGATPLRLTAPGGGAGEALPPSPVVGPPAADASTAPQTQPQPATSGAGAMKPPKGGPTRTLFHDTIFGIDIYWSLQTGEFEVVVEPQGNVADVTQEHHAIPWNNQTYKHHEHKLVELAGVASIKTLEQNIRPLKGHSGRHSVAYHTEVQRRMNEALESVVGQGQVAAYQALLEVIAGIWEDIASGKLRPYDNKDVLLP